MHIPTAQKRTPDATGGAVVNRSPALMRHLPACHSHRENPFPIPPKETKLHEFQKNVIIVARPETYSTAPYSSCIEFTHRGLSPSALTGVCPHPHSQGSVPIRIRTHRGLSPSASASHLIDRGLSPSASGCGGRRSGSVRLTGESVEGLITSGGHRLFDAVTALMSRARERGNDNDDERRSKSDSERRSNSWVSATATPRRRHQTPPSARRE